MLMPSPRCVLARAAASLLLLVFALGFAGCHWSASGKNIHGTALHQQGRYYEAIGQFEQVLAQDPINADGYYNLASSYHGLARSRGDQAMFAQSEQLYNKCLDVSPNHADCHRSLACLLVETGRADKAFTLLDRWSQRSPQSIDPQIELARLYQEFGDKTNAIRHLEQAVAIDANNPNTARAWAALASLREQTGDTQQALMNYYRAQQLNPNQPAVAERIAALQRAMGGPPAVTAPPMTRTVAMPALFQPRF
jgi:tetratricopeptide (TPR) repeat protein